MKLPSLYKEGNFLFLIIFWKWQKYTSQGKIPFTKLKKQRQYEQFYLFLVLYIVKTRRIYETIVCVICFYLA